MDKIMKSSVEIDTSRPSAFISYSWDGEEHIKRVGRLVAELERAGVQVIWDKKDFKLGDPLQYMMTQAIEKCDYVLLACTPRYKEKADSMVGGAGFEESIISGDIFNNQNHRKYIPIIFKGTFENAMPSWAKGKLGVMLTSEEEFKEGVQRLIETINPEPVRPKGFYAVSEKFQCILINHIDSVIESVSLMEYHDCLENMAVLLDNIDLDCVSEEVKKVILKKKEVVEGLIYEDMMDLDNDR